MAKYAAAGHRIVLVIATGGEHGSAPPDLGPGETLADRRRVETLRSAAALGVHRVEFLGYTDSGMAGWEHNGHEGSFWQADVEAAAARLASILVDEGAEILVTYDANGTYGHPDHIQVHRVGHRAAALAGTPAVYEVTMNRDQVTRLVALAIEAGDMDPEEGPQSDDGTEPELGVPESVLTTAVDVRAFIDAKRASMACHASQITDSSFFMRMPMEQFAEAFGTEWYIRTGAPAGIHEYELIGR